MGVTRTVSANGNQQDKPKKGDEVTIEYTGYLYDTSKEANAYRGNQ
jgi:FK506-binding protein 1